MKYSRSILMGLVMASAVSHAESEADQGGSMLSKSGLPECVATVAGSGNAPNWVIQNRCGGTIEIGWCWHKAFSGWRNQNNVCAKTGVISSGLIPQGVQFEFPDRPHTDPATKFSAAAMLSVTRVCRVDSTGVCPKQ